jgi:hypothetical protein
MKAFYKLALVAFAVAACGRDDDVSMVSAVTPGMLDNNHSYQCTGMPQRGHSRQPLSLTITETRSGRFRLDIDTRRRGISERTTRLAEGRETREGLLLRLVEARGGRGSWGPTGETLRLQRAGRGPFMNGMLVLNSHRGGRETYDLRCQLSRGGRRR